MSAEQRSRLHQQLAQAEARVATVHQQIVRRAERHQARVLSCFRRHRIADMHLNGSTGYGYSDQGRTKLDAMVADLMGTERAIVRPHFVSGTHAIASCLRGVLRPGDELLYVTGAPYDTLHPLLGPGPDSLQEWGITWKVVPLQRSRAGESCIDQAAILEAITPRTRMIAFQRSCGYDAERTSLSVADLRRAIRELRRSCRDRVFFVDNCYGELVENREPSAGHGADLVAGSLIKNLGGGLAKTGGYVAGREPWVERVAACLTAPGLGTEVGATHGWLRDALQGLFLAPHMVAEALRGAVLMAAFFEALGYKVDPLWDAPRTDIVQKIHLGAARKLLAFCRGIQAASPIDAHVTPEGAPLPGYDDATVMAAGTFVQGASLELSADGPLRDPYTVYVQGGLVYAHIKWALLEAALCMLQEEGISCP